MTVHMPIAAEADPWPATITAVNAWRGHCLAILAGAETSVSETLLVLAKAGERGGKIKLPHLIGQRSDALAGAIGPDGPFYAEGKNSIDALDAYRAHAPLRNFLCHAPGKIACEKNGRWLLVLKTLSFRASRADHSVRIIEEAESDELLRRLRADCQRLRTCLEQLRATLC